MKSLVRLIGAGVFVLLLTFLLFLMRSGTTSAPDYPKVSVVQGMEEIVVEIPAGSTGSEIAQLLFDKGIVKSSEAFFRVAVGDVRSEKIAPGSHRLTIKISARQSLEQLLDPTRIPNLIKVMEGMWKSEVQEALVNYGFSKVQIKEAFSKVELPSNFSDIEGLLFPAQYSFAEGTSALEAVQAMVNRFSKEPNSQELLKGNKKYSSQQLLIIASIIQAEGDLKDFAKVSRVIYNRLAMDMPLQMDSTVHYIKKVRGQIFLSKDSTLLKSPYNTYRRYGLPPGPIGSPGSAAIAAALNPTPGDWLYFITVAPGDTRFTSSIEEFNSWKVLYTKNRKAGAFN